MLVHVEGEDRDTSRRGLTVIARILIDEPAISRNVDEQYPSGAAGQAPGHGHELTAPTVHGSEVTGESLGKHLGRPSVAEGHACEVQLVEQRRVERDQLFTLQTVDHMTRRLVEVERLELLRDCV